MESSTTSVVVDGVAQPGWKFVNSPVSDSGQGHEQADTVCFELFNGDGVKILQWSALLDDGGVKIGGKGSKDD